MKAVLNGREAQVFEGLNREQLLAVHRSMLLSRKLDDKEIQLKNQSQIFFQISGAGHEAALTAAALTLKSGYDWFFPYYRDRALCLGLGGTPLEMLRAAVGAKDDPASGGRQMPSHWGHTKHNIVSGSSPTGTQVLHGVGAAEAGVIYSRVAQIADRELRHHPDELTYISLGEGATSEGEFWEALNASCTKRLPILFLVEDNGYAISVPVEVQTDAVGLLARRRSVVGVVRDACAARGKAGHDGRGDQPNAERRDGARAAHRRLRRGRRGREQAGGAAARERERRRLQADARPAAAVRR